MSPVTSQWPAQLADGLQQMGLSLQPAQQLQLLDYLQLLQKWNRAFNLTAVRDPAQMVSRQLLDSLSILPLLQGTRLLDIGSGPGLPGVPLAIARPSLRATLLDSNGKKSRFIEQSRMQLGIDNLQVVQSRAETFSASQPFDTITSRAFSSLAVFARLALPLLAADGLLLAMKGQRPDAEIDALQALEFSVQVQSLRVPGSQGERHAILCRRNH